MVKYVQNQPSLIEKIIAGLSYITLGTVGFIWLIIGIFTKNTLKPYLQYHIFQSIFLAIGYFLLSHLLGMVMNILSMIPFVGGLIMGITYYLNMPLIFEYSLIQMVCYTIIAYLVVTSAQGQFSYIPWVSEIIKANVRNS